MGSILPIDVADLLNGKTESAAPNRRAGPCGTTGAPNN